jgi:hypothetical protein
MPAVNPGSGTPIVVDTEVVHQAGRAISKNAQDLQDYLTVKPNQWNVFHTHVAELPGCLRNDFESFYNSQKPLMDKLIGNRGKIGQTLQQAASLWEFQEMVTAKSFDGPNIYAENPYYSSDETNPASS